MSTAEVEVPTTLRRPRISTGGKVLVVRIAVPLLVLLVWAIVASRTDLVPTIGATASALKDGIAAGWMQSALGHTLQATVLGYAIAIAIGVPAAFAIGTSRYLTAVFQPVVTGLFAVPRIVLYPALLAMVGVGVPAEMWLAVISAVFPILLSTLAGVQGVSPSLVKLGRSMRCSPLQMVGKIYLPAAAPSVLTGLRLGFSIALVSVTIAELIASTGGLGNLIATAYSFQELPKMYAMIVVICAVAIVANLVLWAVEQQVSRRMG
jgi:NitT/TauT family transport system permease protein